MAELGTHEELITAEGTYARLFRLQASRLKAIGGGQMKLLAVGLLGLGMAIAAARWAAGRWSAVTGEYRRNA